MFGTIYLIIAIDHKVLDIAVLLILMIRNYLSYYIHFMGWKYWLCYETEQNIISQNFVNSKSWVSQENDLRMFCTELVHLL